MPASPLLFRECSLGICILLAHPPGNFVSIANYLDFVLMHIQILADLPLLADLKKKMRMTIGLLHGDKKGSAGGLERNLRWLPSLTLSQHPQ